MENQHSICFCLRAMPAMANGYERLCKAAFSSNPTVMDGLQLENQTVPEYSGLAGAAQRL